MISSSSFKIKLKMVAIMDMDMEMEIFAALHRVIKLFINIAVIQSIAAFAMNYFHWVDVLHGLHYIHIGR